ncbi:hypothetical protein AVEN_149390-1 [Araneus ventricosus]|uniref:Uncharacterized protein n=1 Tax=Araneus ventricosus TaxID=182803 RepID=A0A4Y2SJU1_ARAVE|nr:hypothetical protein AVEN_149390-1 [Araneus ventricosus]
MRNSSDSHSHMIRCGNSEVTPPTDQCRNSEVTRSPHDSMPQLEGDSHPPMIDAQLGGGARTHDDSRCRNSRGTLTLHDSMRISRGDSRPPLMDANSKALTHH